MRYRSNLKSEKYSDEHIAYLRKIKRESFLVKLTQISVFVGLIILWEIAAQFKWIDSFIMSSPLRVYKTLVMLNNSGQLWSNVWVTVCETVCGFVLGTTLGIILAILVWWSEFLSKVLEPYMVVLNALPKVALGPIIIVWVGAGVKSIIIMALLVSVIIATINIMAGFKSIDKEKILLMKSFGASKIQVLFKLIIPANISAIISTLKINVGMSLIGVITGEFLVASKGVGYLIVYGGQVFKLDLVMAGIFVLCVIATAMYLAVATFEKIYLRSSRK